MGCPMQNSRLAEVFIQRYKDPSLLVSNREDGFVTGNFLPISTPGHVMVCRLKGGLCSACNAGVEENIQYPNSMARGSMRSLAITLRA